MAETHQLRELPVQTNNKKQALFGLEILMRCRSNSTKLYMLIDWLDVRKMWEKSQRFWFFPHIKGGTMSDLFEQIRSNLNENIKRGAHCLLWLSFPEDSRDRLSVVQEFIWEVRGVFPSALFGVGTTTDKDYNATLCIMEGNSNDCAIIKQCIKDAGEMKVEQADMVAFLKRTFGTALETLEEMVADGIDLTDNEVVANLQELILAINQIPQGRVRAFSVSTVIDDFEELVERFYGILARPHQDAEASFTCDWLVSRLNSLAEEPDEVDAQRLERYLAIAKTLAENGSDKIRAYLAEAAEHLAHELTFEWMQEEAKAVWDYAIELLSQENLRIIQREGRLRYAQTNLELVRDGSDV